MRWILSGISTVFVLASVCMAGLITYPETAHAQTVPPGYRLQCSNGVCRLVRIRPAYPVVEYGVPTQQVVQYAPQITQNANYVRTVSFVADDGNNVDAPTNSVAAPYVGPVVQNIRMGATNCGCATSGVCVCAPGTCTCVGCPGNIYANMGFAPTVQYNSMQSGIIGYAPGFVGVTYDGFGNAYVTTAGVSRRIARHIRKGIRLGITY